MTITSENVKGAIAAVLVGGLGLWAYSIYQNDGAGDEDGPMSVERVLDRFTEGGMDSHPEDTYKTTLDGNLPLFLAFLDYDANLTDDLVAEYREKFERLDTYYAQDTPKQVVEAIFDIHAAGTETGYYTYMAAMDQLLESVPQALGPETTAPVANVSSLVVAERIHTAIMTEYYRPIVEADQAEEARLQAEAEYEWQAREAARARILQDQAEARQRGQAKNAARNARAAERSRRYQALVNAEQRKLNNQIRRDEQRRQQWQRWYFNY